MSPEVEYLDYGKLEHLRQGISYTSHKGGGVYSLIEHHTGIECTGPIGDVGHFLQEITRYLMNHWDNDMVFLLWERLYLTEWNRSLPRLLRVEPEFMDVEARYRADSRRAGKRH